MSCAGVISVLWPGRLRGGERLNSHYFLLPAGGECGAVPRFTVYGRVHHAQPLRAVQRRKQHPWVAYVINFSLVEHVCGFSLL